MENPSSWLSKVNSNLPIGNLDWIQANIIPFVISLLLFIAITASLIFLLIGGISWITSSGNKEGLAKAKNTVTYAIIGLILALGSFIILNITLQFLGVVSPPRNYTPVPERQHGEYNPE